MLFVRCDLIGHDFARLGRIDVENVFGRQAFNSQRGIHLARTTPAATAATFRLRISGCGGTFVVWRIFEIITAKINYTAIIEIVVEFVANCISGRGTSIGTAIGVSCRTLAGRFFTAIVGFATAACFAVGARFTIGLGFAIGLRFIGAA